MNAPTEAGRFGSGKTVRRIEDPLLVVGQGQFTDDLTRPGQLHLVFLRSPYAHARIASVDTSMALAVPGVVAVLCGADLLKAGVQPMPAQVPFVRADGSPFATAARHVLATDRVRYVGEAVAAVIAESREAATQGTESILVDYEDLPAVTSAPAAMAPGAPALCDAAPDNIACEARHGNAAAVAAAFAKAAHVVSVEIDNQRVAPTPMEPRVVLAEIDADSGRLHVRLSSQMPTAVLGGICAAIPGLDAKQVRVLVGDVGGGFGMKGGVYPEDIVTAYAAWTLKRPVKWCAQRLEEFLAAAHGRDAISRSELALDANGRVLALRVRSIANVGGYATGTGVMIPLIVGPWVSTSIYDIQTIDIHASAVMTNTAPVGAYRGAGRPEAIYIIERLMDAAARAMKLDPAELRRRNLVRPEQMPYTNPMAQVYDCGEFEKILDQGLALADWNGFAARRDASKQRGRLRGRGLASFLEWTSGMSFEEKVSVSVTPDGVVEIFTATQAMGQGIATSYAQLAVDVFEVPIERIRIVQGDTDRGQGFGSAGSRSLFVGGSAVRIASEKTVAHARELAAEALEVPATDLEYRAARFTVAGTDLGIDLFALAGKQPAAKIEIDATGGAAGVSWPNGAHVCEVEIDPVTGEVEVVAYTSVNDIGRIVSPTIVRGQIEGGAVQGIGQALCEHMVYDADSGQALSASLMDYCLPRVDGFRAFRTEFDTSVPCKTNILGAKGVGELGTIGATPAVVNAVIDALDHAGHGRAAERVQMPLTSERIWRALQGDFGPSPMG